MFLEVLFVLFETDHHFSLVEGPILINFRIDENHFLVGEFDSTIVVYVRVLDEFTFQELVLSEALLHLFDVQVVLVNILHILALLALFDFLLGLNALALVEFLLLALFFGLVMGLALLEIAFLLVVFGQALFIGGFSELLAFLLVRLLVKRLFLLLFVGLLVVGGGFQ